MRDEHMNEVQKNRIDRITVLHAEIGGYLKTTLTKAIEIGGILAELKAETEHGGWIPWINENLPFSPRLASDYMKFHEHRDELKTARLADLAAAREFLAPTPKQETPEPIEIDRSQQRQDRHDSYLEQLKREDEIRKEYEKTTSSGHRKDGESVAEHIARREKAADEAKKATKAIRADREKQEIEELRQEFPDHKVTPEGVKFRCSVCKKQWFDKYADPGKPNDMCSDCRTAARLKEHYPGHEIKVGKAQTEYGEFLEHRVKFVCEQCGDDFLERMDEWDTEPARFCSDYCKYVSGLKTPPQWTREEWDRIKGWEKEKKQERWYRAGSYAWEETSDETFDLGDPNDDSKQTALFAALDQYFEGFDDTNRKLHALHNLVKKLKHIGSDYQADIANGSPAEEPVETLAIESH
jgi:hypothetical protein